GGTDLLRHTSFGLHQLFYPTHSKVANVWGIRPRALYFLAPKTDVEPFGNKARKIRLAGSTKLLLSGAWPPHNSQRLDDCMELDLWNHLPSYCHVLSKSDLFQSLIGMTGVAYHVLCSGRGLKTALSWQGQRNMAKVATASGFGRL